MHTCTKVQSFACLHHMKGNGLRTSRPRRKSLKVVRASSTVQNESNGVPPSTAVSVPPKVPRLSAHEATCEVVCEQLDKWGCCVVEGLVSTDLCDDIIRELEPHATQRKTYSEGGKVGLKDMKEFSGLNTKRVLGILGKSQQSWKLAAHPLVEQVTEHMLLPFCENVVLMTSLLRSQLPGEGNQPLHQDRHSIPDIAIPPRPGYSDHRPLTPGMQWGVATLWALSDSTVENGATRVVPGSHRWSSDAHHDDADWDTWSDHQGEKQYVAGSPMARSIHNATHATMDKGSVLFYLSAVVHGGSANTSTSSRDLILLTYGPGWIRQEENMFLTVQPTTAMRMPAKLQRLIGYSLHGQTMGMVDVDGDYGDPQAWLETLKLPNLE